VVAPEAAGKTIIISLKGLFYLRRERRNDKKMVAQIGRKEEGARGGNSREALRESLLSKPPARQ